MKKTKCKTCKASVASLRGRPPKYCSAACRQKAYRARLLIPVPIRLIPSDIDKAAARARHVRALNLLGYDVELQPRTAAPKVFRKPRLSIVPTPPK